MKRLSLAIVLLARLGLTAPAASSSISIRFELLNEPSEMQLTVANAATKEVLGRSCSDKLDSGKFANWPVSINLDASERGTGTITLGTNTQQMEYNADPAASLSCERIFDDRAILISCKAIVSGIELASTDGSIIGNCLSDQAVSLAAVADAMEAGGSADGPAAPPIALDGTNSTEVDGKRQVNPCSQWTPETRLIGNGDPWQHHLHTQFSQPIRCSNTNGCSATFSETRGITFSANLGGAAGWISGGFSVQYSETTGNSYTCNGGKRETVCVWYDQAFTEYNVVSGSRNGCGQFSSTHTAKISSPNSNNRGGRMYCVSGGHCRAKNDRYWQLYTRRGGP